jgi:hypothetical protein
MGKKLFGFEGEQSFQDTSLKDVAGNVSYTLMQANSFLQILLRFELRHICDVTVRYCDGVTGLHAAGSGK